jgi:glycosyltransferase involved in cell wall biosynthesis
MIAMINELQKRGCVIDILFLDREHNLIGTDVLHNVTILPFSLVVASKFDFQRQKMIHRDEKELNTLNQQDDNSHDFEEQKKIAVRKTQLAIEISVLNRMPKLDLTNYDCVISWEDLTCNDFLAYNVKAKYKIGYIHPDYVITGYDKRIDLPTLSRLDKIIGVSEATTLTLKQVFPELAEKIEFIPNVMNIEEIKEKAKEEVSDISTDAFVIVTVCRLSIFHKGLDRLVRVERSLEKMGLKFQWYLIGEGDGRNELKKYISDHSLKDIHLLGGRDNPYPYIKRANLFVLLSNYEGRPIVVDEAMILGVPVLVTNYDSAKEQVSTDRGWVVDMDDDAVCSKMEMIISGKSKLLENKPGCAKWTEGLTRGADTLLALINGNN